VHFVKVSIVSTVVVALVVLGGIESESLLFSPTTAQKKDDHYNQHNLCDFHHIKKFDTNGKLVTSWGEKGTGDGQFIHPHGIAVDSQGNVFVADEERQDVQKFNSSGTFLTKWGWPGRDPGQFSSRIGDINVDSEDNVYVVDYGNNRIQKFTNDGKFITVWGLGNKTGQFNEHHGIDFDFSGLSYVADTANQQIQVFTPDGKFIKSWGTMGVSDDQFLMPQDIAIDSSQNVYVSDSGDAHPELRYIEKVLTENKALTQRVCIQVDHPAVHEQINDVDLAIETIQSNLEAPTAMTFLGPDDILVTEKNTGKVKRIVNGEMLDQPLLDLDVANQNERGLLGMAVLKNTIGGNQYVFLFYTEAKDRMGEVNDTERQSNGGDGGEPIGNRLYRYEFSEDRTKLLNPNLLLDLPYEPGPSHNGGAIAVGGHNNSNNVCVIMGNLEVRPLNEGTGTNLAQNVQGGDKPDGRAGIICVTPDGKKINYDYGTEGGGILGDENPLDMYYAYGIRNGFGIAFDPLTGNLWDTENGGFDEINLVEPGFNSGYSVINGSSLNDANKRRFDQEDLVDFAGNGKYSDPELDLGQHIGPTAIVFLDSEDLGKEYENDLLVGTVTGKILYFDLDKSRRHLVLEGKLADKIANSQEELEDVVFADGIGTITDLKVGPDGYLYAVIFTGDIVRIIPEEEYVDTDEQIKSAHDKYFGD
jgi:glucose/arabinose dehydrogenase